MKKTMAVCLFVMVLCFLGIMPGIAATDQPVAKPDAQFGGPDKPVPVPNAQKKITVDGNPAKWTAIKALPAPNTNKPAGAIKLQWSTEGLYGLLQVKDDKIDVNVDTPWSSDCVEIWLETDFARAGQMSDNAFQIVLAPNPNALNGKSLVLVPQGTMDAEAIKAITKTSKEGYTIEFFIPAKELTGAKMVVGTKIGFDYSVDLKGKSVESFAGAKTATGGYANPSVWGAIQLAK